MFRKSMLPQTVLAILVVILLLALPCPVSAANGHFELLVVDSQTKQPVACRIHLKTPSGRPRKEKGFPFWEDHFAIPGKISMDLPLGNYKLEIERGPEYLSYYDGGFTIKPFADDSRTIEMHRVIDMAAQGWWSGDLDVRRPPAEMELIMQADDLHVAEVVTWWNDKSAWESKPLPKQATMQFGRNHVYHLLAGGLAYPGGTLMCYNLPGPLKLANAAPEYPPRARYLEQCRVQSQAWIDLTAAYWWDLPMLVANRLIDSVRLANDRMCRRPVPVNEAGGKPRDRTQYPDPRGNARWSQDIYFHLLNCGLRLPPSAGSGSGESPNPIGYNRMYVHVDGDLTYEQWWDGFRAGRVAVTNGPLLLPTVEGQFPGHVFQAEAGKPLDLEIALNFTTTTPLAPVSYLEIIQDGRVEHSVRLDAYAKTGKLPKVHFDRSGWFLIRAVSDVAETYRFAMTGPYYVEVGSQPRVSKRSAQFFLDWVYERARQIKLADPAQHREVLEYHRKARDFWQALVARANAE